MKILRQKRLWYDWLINYILKLKTMVVGVKDIIMSLFKTNTTKNCSERTRVSGGRKNLGKPK